MHNCTGIARKNAMQIAKKKKAKHCESALGSEKSLNLLAVEGRPRLTARNAEVESENHTMIFCFTPTELFSLKSRRTTRHGVGSATANASPFLKAHNALSHILHLCEFSHFPCRNACRRSMAWIDHPSRPLRVHSNCNLYEGDESRMFYGEQNEQNAHFDRQHFVVGGWARRRVWGRWYIDPTHKLTHASVHIELHLGGRGEFYCFCVGVDAMHFSESVVHALLIGWFMDSSPPARPTQ